MAITIKPIDPTNRAFFAGVVSGADWSKPLSDEGARAIHAGMDQYGVLVFHDQHVDDEQESGLPAKTFADEQQLAFSRKLGPLEEATGDIAAPQDRRLGMELGDISNLDKN